MTFCIRRREFIAGLGGTASWPLTARAQQGDRVRRIGLLLGGDENHSVLLSALAFEQALAGLGWTNGGNVRMDIRAYVGDTNQELVGLIRTRAQELVGLQPDIVLAVGAPGTVALQLETRTIPIIFVSAVDPVASGIVARLDRPGGNVTGFASEKPSLGSKWLELLSEIAPGLKRVAIMFHPRASPASSLFVPSFETAARSLKVVPTTVPVHSDAEIETAVSALGREPGGGLVVIPGVFAYGSRASIISATARNNVPAVYAISDSVRDGGLLYYGVNRVETMRRAAAYVDRILRGAKPGDLPVQFPTKFEMAVNLMTAKALGLAVPQSILLRADEVIE